jgi:hypothetical protein
MDVSCLAENMAQMFDTKNRVRIRKSVWWVIVYFGKYRVDTYGCGGSG